MIRTHTAVEECHEQCCSMGTVDISIGHDHNLCDSGVSTCWGLLNPLPCRWSRRVLLVYIDDFIGIEHFMLHRFLNIRDLSAKRKNCLISRVTTLLLRTSAESPSTRKKARIPRHHGSCRSKLAGKTRARQRALALHAHSGTVGGMTCLRHEHNLVDYRLCLRRVLLKIITQSLAHSTPERLLRPHCCQAWSLSDLRTAVQRPLRKITAVSPSRKSSLISSIFSFFQKMVVICIFLECGRETAAGKPVRCVPPSMVLILLT